MKIKEFQETLTKKRIDCAVFITSSYNAIDPNISYFAGMSAEWCAVVIPSAKKGKPFFIIPRMELEKAKKISRIKKILPLRHGQNLAELLAQNVSGSKTIGINESSLTLSSLKSLKKGFHKLKKLVKFKNVSGIIRNIRSIKSNDEIKRIKIACKLTDQIFSDIIHNFKNFKTEKDIAKFIETRAQELGVKPSFPPIIASGKNASMPHYTPKEAPLQKGFCIMDFGVRYKGYCADMTRTVYIGNPSIQEIKTYQTVLNCQKKAIILCASGKKSSTIFKNSAKELRQYQKYSIHGLGHGIGIEIHESPSLGLKSKDVLKEGMVFTIEPGIYVPDKFGIRIEDDVLLAKKGAEILTKSTKNMILVKKN